MTKYCGGTFRLVKKGNVPHEIFYRPDDESDWVQLFRVVSAQLNWGNFSGKRDLTQMTVVFEVDEAHMIIEEEN